MSCRGSPRRPFPGTRPDGVLGQSPIQRQCLHASGERGALPARHPAHRRTVRAGPLRAHRRAPIPASRHTREALANALCHRDYSIGGGSVGIAVYDDRLEITSSGSLHFGLTPEKLFSPHESRPWNPLIARTFYRRGIIEEWGSGTLKMADLASSSGLPVPEIEDDGGAVTVRFRHSLFVPSAGEQ